MVQYWITTSNWYSEKIQSRPCSGAINRQEKQIWWYHNQRDEINSGDKVIIYQSGKNEEADKENIKIDEKLKMTFIGDFTVDKIINRSDSTIPDICWAEPNGGWLKTLENNFLWALDTIIKRESVDDDLLTQITCSSNVGLVFWRKTWIKIDKKYYDLVFEKKH